MKVPLNIFQTHKDETFLSEECKKNRDEILKNNKEWTYHFYNDDAIDKFMKEYYIGKIYDAYKVLNIGAAKSDLWRYCVLYKYGGVYFDMDVNIKCKLIDIIDKNYSFYYDNGGNLIQYFLHFDKNSKILKNVIDNCVKRIENRESNIFLATGPTMFTDTILNHYNTRQLDAKLKIGLYKVKPTIFGNINDIDIEEHYVNYKREDLYNNGLNHYFVSLGPTPSLYNS